MAEANGGRITSLAFLNTDGGLALLAQQYRAVIENVESYMLSSRLKNQDLSGDFDAGSVEAKRFANAVSQQYGTAAANGIGADIKLLPVNVPINMHREIIENLERYDAATLGVPDLIARRTRNHARTMARELERAFFACAQTAGTAFTTSETNIEAILEDLIQTIETTQNDFVDGVPRDMIHLVCSPDFYGQIRAYLDKSYNANIQTNEDDFFAFHGVRTYASTYLPAGVNCIAMVEGAVAQPVRSDVYSATELPLGNNWALKLFYDFGTTAVTPDLIQVYSAASTMGTLVVSSVKGTTAGSTKVTVNPTQPASGNSYVYKLGAAPETVAYGANLSTGWTDMPADGIIAASTNAYITVAEANSSDEAVGAGSAKIVKK